MQTGRHSHSVSPADRTVLTEPRGHDWCLEVWLLLKKNKWTIQVIREQLITHCIFFNNFRKQARDSNRHNVGWKVNWLKHRRPAEIKKKCNYWNSTLTEISHLPSNSNLIILLTPFSSSNVLRLTCHHWLREALTSLRNFRFLLRDGGAHDSCGTLTSYGSVLFVLPVSPGLFLVHGCSQGSQQLSFGDVTWGKQLAVVALPLLQC